MPPKEIMTSQTNADEGGDIKLTAHQQMIAKVKDVLEDHHVAAILFDEQTYLRAHVTAAEDYAQLLNQFNGKTEAQISNMLVAGMRYYNLTTYSLSGLDFTGWINYLKWLNSAAGAEAIRVNEPFTSAQDAMLSDFDMQRRDLVETEKAIHKKYEDIALELKRQLERQKILVQQELRTNRAHFLPASAYTPSSLEEFNLRCWDSYRTIYAADPPSSTSRLCHKWKQLVKRLASS